MAFRNWLRGRLGPAAEAADVVAFAEILGKVLPEQWRGEIERLSVSMTDGLVPAGVSQENVGKMLLAAAAMYVFARQRNVDETQELTVDSVSLSLQAAVKEIHETQDLSSLPKEWQNNPFLLIYSALTDQTEDLEKLLAGQDEMKAQIGALFHTFEGLPADYADAYRRDSGRIDAIHEAVTAPPLLSVKNPSGYRPKDTARLVFRNRPTPMAGRDTEVEALIQFLYRPRPFLWWMWYGPAGTGKSRLGLELIDQARGLGWDAAFYDRRSHSTTCWAQWTPKKDTLIVFDYARELAGDIADAIMTISNNPKEKHVRFLLLDRTWDENEIWVREFKKRLDHEDDRQAEPRRLTPLDIDDYLKIAYPVYRDRCSVVAKKTPVLEPEFDAQMRPHLVGLLQQTDGDRKEDLRPLAALFVAEAVAEEGFQAGRSWRLDAVADWWLEREVLRWRDEGVTEKAVNLLVLATALGGLSNAQRLELATGPLAGIIPAGESVEHWDTVQSASLSEKNVDFPPLEPDILGEALALNRCDGKLRIESGTPNPTPGDTLKVLEGALASDEEEDLAGATFILHCGQDFPHHPKLGDLLLGLDLPVMQLVRADLVTTLTLSGNESLADHLIETIESIRLRSVSLNNKGVALGRMGRNLEAIECYERVAATPDVPTEQKAEAVYNKGIRFAQMGRDREAIECYESVAAMPNVSPDQKSRALYNQGAKLGQLDRNLEAIECYERVAAMPDAPAEEKSMALYNKGVRLALMGRNQEALECYERVAALPDAPVGQVSKALNNKGAVLGQMGLHRQAIECLERVEAMTKAPAEQIAIALNNKGIALGQMGLNEEVIECLERVEMIADAPTDQRVIGLNNKGVALGKLGRYEEAIDCFERVEATADAPIDQSFLALENRGVALAEMGRIEEAIDCFERIETMDHATAGQRSKALNNKGIALGKIGRFDEVLGCSERVEAIVEAPAEQRALALDNRGAALAQMERYEEAIECFERFEAFADAPSEYKARAFYGKGVVLGRVGRNQEAIESYERLIAMSEAPLQYKVMALNNKGAVLGLEGRFAEALVCYEQLAQIEGVPTQFRTQTLKIVSMIQEQLKNQGK